MLVLTRKPNQSIFIGENIRVTVVEIKGNQVRIGIEAPSDTRILREEIHQTGSAIGSHNPKSKDRE